MESDAALERFVNLAAHPETQEWARTVVKSFMGLSVQMQSAILAAIGYKLEKKSEAWIYTTPKPITAAKRISYVWEQTQRVEDFGIGMLAFNLPGAKGGTLGAVTGGVTTLVGGSSLGTAILGDYDIQKLILFGKWSEYRIAMGDPPRSEVLGSTEAAQKELAEALRILQK